EGVITGRIRQLAPAQQTTLKAASAIGPVFTLDLLRPLTGSPDLRHGLDRLAELSFLQPQPSEPERVYAFKHPITWHAAYKLMTRAQRRERHAAVAAQLEQTHTAGPAWYTALLAYHRRAAAQAGEVDFELYAQAIDWIEKAGDESMRHGMVREATGFFATALSLTVEQKRPATEAPGGPGTALTPLRPAPPVNLREARWERLLGQVRRELGQHSKSRAHLRQALVHLGRPLPATTGALAAGLLRQALQQGWHYIRPRQPQTRPPRAQAVRLEAARIYERLAASQSVSDEKITAGYLLLRGINLAERAGAAPELAQLQARLVCVCRAARLRRPAEMYRRRALESAEKAQNLSVRASVLARVGGWSYGFYPWADVQTAFERARALYSRLGDRRGRGNSAAGLALAHYFQAHFATALQAYADMYTLGLDSDNLQHQAWGLNGRGMSLLRLGQTGQAATLLEQAQEILPKVGPFRVAEVLNRGLVAVAYLRQGRRNKARQAADTAARLIAQSPPAACAMLEGYAGAAEVYLALCEAGRSNGPAAAQTTALKMAARQACRALHRYAQIFPVGLPRAWLSRGLYNRLNGRPDQARKAWRNSLAHARQLAMPYDEGLAHFYIGRYAPAGDSARQEHLLGAIELFKKVGAAYELARAEEALSTPAEHAANLVPRR
ncbi:MAG: hypothetical protein ACE5G8_15820, partial [Anaerolineae bacterium]